MVKGKYVRTLQSEDMEYIPAGGRTFPLYVFTNNPPYTGLNVTLSVLNNDTLAVINTSTLVFGGGDFNVSLSSLSLPPSLSI